MNKESKYKDNFKVRSFRCYSHDLKLIVRVKKFHMKRLVGSILLTLLKTNLSFDLKLAPLLFQPPTSCKGKSEYVS